MWGHPAYNPVILLTAFALTRHAAWPRLLTLGICLGVVTTAAPAHALDPDKRLSAMTVEIFRAQDGIAGAVKALEQTPDGYLWVGTSAGLFRYGGARFTVLTEGGRGAVPSEGSPGDVTALLAAVDGTLWVAPARGAPLCVRAAMMVDCPVPWGNLGSTVRFVDWHRGPRESLIATTNLGLLAALPHGWQPVPWGHAVPRDLEALHIDEQGRIVAAGKREVVTLQITGLPATVPAPSAPPPSTPVIAAAGPAPADLEVLFAGRERGSGVVWGANETGLWRIEDGRAALVSKDGPPPGGQPSAALEDRDGNVWIGSRRGLWRWQPGRVNAAFTRADGLPEDDVTALLEDREGSLWVGTRGGGLAQFTDRTVAQAGPPSLSERWINSLTEDSAGAFWLATRTGLVRWQDGRERSFGRAEGLPSDTVFAVHAAADGSVWVGCDAGLARMRGDRVESVHALGRSISALAIDEKGDLWVGGDEIARFEEGRLVTFPSAPGAEVTELRGMAHDDEGVLWLSSRGRLLSIRQGRVELPPPGDPIIGKVRSLHRDRKGVLWLGTFDGLWRRQGGTWRGFGVAEGLTQDLFQVLTDDADDLWAGTPQGLIQLSRASLEELLAGRRRTLDVLALPSSDQRRDIDASRPRQPAAWKARDGSIWFATSRGAVRVDPRRVRRNVVVPPIVIESATVDGRPAQRGAENAFPPGSGALDFSFGAVTTIEPHRAKHRYRLVGFDSTWIEAGTRRVASYTNIPPGAYRFEVQGSNADGVWNETGDVLQFRLAPRFHQTAWFYGLVALALGCAAFGVHRVYVAGVHSRYAATFAERNRVARELHDSLLQGMAAAALHLKSLRKRVVRGATGGKPDEVAAELERIERLVGTNMEETRRYVWDLRDSAGGNDSLETGLKALVSGLSGRANVHLTVEGAISPVPPHVSRELLRITREAIHNALQHAGADRIDVQLQQVAGALRLIVSDDGRGFDPKAAVGSAQGHFGLTGMQERARGLGRLQIVSRPGEGTRVEMIIEGTGIA